MCNIVIQPLCPLRNDNHSKSSDSILPFLVTFYSVCFLLDLESHPVDNGPLLKWLLLFTFLNTVARWAHALLVLSIDVFAKESAS